MRLIPAFFFFASLIFCSAETTTANSTPPPAAATEANIFDSVLRIEVATQVPDYRTPWAPGGFSGGRGTGFLIGPNQILTNAHVVANARRVLVTMRNSSRKLPAQVKYVAHDCDLALLALDDPSPLEGLLQLPIGEMPALDSEVRAIGYPVGGDRLSVTRGIVSRIDFQAYSHSRVDSHLIIQVDAAINPGNSGGPAIQDDKVIGVAFQGLRQADNTGYIIPTPVIRRFLKDVEDGRYDQYVDLGLSHFSLFNPAMRKALGLPDDDKGVLVTSVLPTGACDGIIEVNDVLLSIDGKSIDSAGNIEVDGELINLNEVVERKFAGDKIALEYLRGDERKEAEVTLVTVPATRIYGVRYGERPRYVFYAGLVLQPLNLNVMSAHRIDNLNVRKLYADYLDEGIFQERPDLVTITRIEMDELTSELNEFKKTVINTINGTPVRDLQHAYDLLYAEDAPEFTVIECEGVSRPLVIPSAKAKQANERLMQINNIQSTHYLGK
ncbi:MAG: trypsin-like peptidase domain-containing protein [Verrucomicrobiota bacterium JB023]|nr:trypsin-like peptidase domain-containing protein [Verrucomicrobiota bacterium JB023]